MIDTEKYVALRNNHANSQEVYLAAKSDGNSLIHCLMILREVFNLSVVEAKEVYVIAEGAASLEEHQAKLTPALEEALKLLENDENTAIT
jgi:hypothetical protein